MNDHELLNEFTRKRTPDAFRQLVERHIAMVYATANRIVRDLQLAQDVTQQVFITLAQKSATVVPPQIVGGWLYNTSRHLAFNTHRAEQRRRDREQTAVTMQLLDQNPEANHILEQLEPAMDDLETEERDALVLRFLEDRSLREVGVELGVSEDAARMRVNRALERLRTTLTGRGVAATSVVLTSVLTASSASAVPAGLTATVAAAGLGATSLTTVTVATAHWFGAKAAAAMVGAALISGGTAYWLQHQRVEKLQVENQALAAQQTKLTTDNQTAFAAVQANQDELERLRKNTPELLRLRADVAKLRRDLDEKSKLAGVKTPPQQPATTSNLEHRYVSKDQLANVGYATPSTALQTITWAMMTGNYDEAKAALGPELAKNDPDTPEDRANFEKGRQTMAPLFKGIQVVAQKAMPDGKVELKVKYDYEPEMAKVSKVPMPEFMIQPMVKVGNDWKLGGSTRGYNQRWAETGHIENFPD